ncbi:alpha/beta fold hydrolase [Bacteroidota bacterium]
MYSSNEILQLNKQPNKYNLTTQNQFSTSEYVALVDDFFKPGIDGFFNGEKGISIYYKYFLQNSMDNEKGAIVISNGRRENTLKYKELIYDLYQNGYSVYILDHRGQGFSERIIETDSRMGHIDDFEYYVSDLKNYYDNFVKINNHKKIFLLAHSMGATIGTRYIQKFPYDFDSAALSSPMFGLKFPTCKLIRLLVGDEPGYVFGKKNYDNETMSFSSNNLTHSKIRFEAMMNMYENYPSTKIGGPSYQWVYQSCITFKKIFKELQKIEIPVLLMLAGKEDVVSSRAQRKYFYGLRKLNKDVKCFTVPGAYHELLIENDDFRLPVIATIIDFFSNSSSNLTEKKD